MNASPARARLLLRHALRVGGAIVPLALPLIVGAQGITNPLRGGCETIDQCIFNVVRYALGLAGILALAGIVYGGFLYITAAGNQDRIEDGKRAVTYSVIGLVIIGLAYAIVTFVFRALGGEGGGGLEGGVPGLDGGRLPGGIGQ